MRREAAGSDWSAVATADGMRMALRADGALYGWGYGPGGLGGGLGGVPFTRLLSGSYASLTLSAQSSCAIDADGGLYCNGHLVQAGKRLRTHRRIGTASWSAIAVGGHGGFACGIYEAGTLWCWGYGSMGQLGQGGGSAAEFPKPTQVGEASDWIAVSAGTSHACGLRGGGSLWCWGSNVSGELGLGTGGQLGHKVARPTRVGGQRWRQVSASRELTCGVRVDGSLWCWGFNAHGQLGDGSDKQRGRPNRLGTDRDWRSVGAGDGHACALKTNGSLWCWGANDHGQVGVASEGPLCGDEPADQVPCERSPVRLGS